MDTRIKLISFKKEIEKEQKKVEDGAKKFNDLISQSNILLASKGRQELTNQEMRGFIQEPRIILTKKLVEGVKISGMVLTETKVLEIMEVSIHHFSKNVDDLQGVVEFIKLENGKFIPDPVAMKSIENRFTEYATTPEEIEVVQSLEKIMMAFDELQSKVGIKLNFMALCDATKGAINTYFGERCFKTDSVKLLAANVIKENSGK